MRFSTAAKLLCYAYVIDKGGKLFLPAHGQDEDSVDLQSSGCNPMDGFCLFETELSIDLGDKTHLLNYDYYKPNTKASSETRNLRRKGKDPYKTSRFSDPKASFEVITKRWLNECQGDLYGGLDVSVDSMLQSTLGSKKHSKKGKGNGKCKGALCPKLVNIKIPNTEVISLDFDKSRQLTEGCRGTLLEALRKGNRYLFGNLKKVHITSSIRSVKLTQIPNCNRQCEAERTALRNFFYSSTKVKKDAGNNNDMCRSSYIQCGENLSINAVVTQEVKLRGSIPTEIGTLVHNQKLNLAINDISGSMPTQIGDQTKLEVLKLYSNKLVGTIPTEIGRLSLLNQLELGGNKLQGTIPTEIGLLKNLEILTLNHNNMQGTIPTEIGLLKKLEILTLDGNQLQGTIPTEIGLLRNLKTLLLNGNNLSHLIPIELCCLKKLINDNLDAKLSCPKEMVGVSRKGRGTGKCRGPICPKQIPYPGGGEDGGNSRGGKGGGNSGGGGDGGNSGGGKPDKGFVCV